jgi:hypothetical protein
MSVLGHKPTYAVQQIGLRELSIAVVLFLNCPRCWAELNLTRRTKMMKVATPLGIAAAACFAFGVSLPVQAQQTAMSFFITSVGLGKGGDLGGLPGADRHCQSLAAAAGAGGKTWHAYLSTQGAGGVNAKDRIGKGPWVNAKGAQIAANVADLHGDKNNINKQTGLDEKGMAVKGRGDTPNQHDMLTGTRQDGSAITGPDDATCSNWTVSTDGQGGAVVGHFDLIGNTNGPNFWNYSHKTPGCAPANLQRVGGAGLFYCFAVD